jgi:signal transduction histidine kinase/ActR/RegA family two-component response regulator
MTSAIDDSERIPRPAQIHVALVIATGAILLATYLPRALPHPLVFALLLAASCLTSAWKINLPISLASGSTLSVSYAANLMALLLAGPQIAVVIAAIGAWTQCTFHVKRRYPAYRTMFSIAAEIVTMVASGAVYQAFGGTTEPIAVSPVLRPLAGAIAAYFFVNTGLVAGAVALSKGRSAWTVWREDFAWSATSFMVAGGAGALAAVVIARGEQWKALFLLAPVYLTYRTYRLFTARLEEERRHNAEMEAANRLKDQFLATLSHELRTPLNAILGWSEMLRTNSIRDSRREHAAQAIFNNATRQARLIDELLDMARIMAGKLRLEIEDVEPRDVVRGAIEIAQPDAVAKRIRLNVSIDPAAGALRGDAGRIQQVLWNLLANAVKYTPAGGRIDLRVRGAGARTVITVTDSGPGIPPEFLPVVFEPFRQADATSTRSHGGLGLGLAIVKHLVEAHGGTIAATNGPNAGGATFTVTLPASPRVSAPAPRREAPAAPLLSSLDGLSVLVVDDDEASRGVVAAHLENHRASVFTAASAAEALDLLARERVDVLLADIAMPGEDGYSLLRKLRALDESPIRAIPAAALTAFARDEDRRAALAAGFQMHLPKPIDAASLVSAVALLGNGHDTPWRGRVVVPSTAVPLTTVTRMA